LALYEKGKLGGVGGREGGRGRILVEKEMHFLLLETGR